MKILSAIVISAALLPTFLPGFAADTQPAVKSPSFQNDLSALRKEIVPMCAQLQADKPKESKKQLLAEIDAIIAGWKTVAETYKTNPPAQYSKDPSWPGYFNVALDNFQIMRARTEQENYKRAMQFCGMNCGLFVTINQVSGVDKLTDKMFVVRKNAKTMMNMVKAQNWNGADKVCKHNEKMVEAMMKSPAPSGVAKAVFEQDMKTAKAAYDNFLKAVNTKDIKESGKRFKVFIKNFGEVYAKYL